MPYQLEDTNRCKVLDDLFNQFKEENIDLNRFSSSDIERVKSICNQTDTLLWIHNYAKIEPFFINDSGRDYFGFDSNDLSNEGFDFFANLVHPDDMPVIHNTVTFYMQQPNGTNRLAYRARRHDGMMRWLFSFDRVLNFNGAGSPQYILAASIDIEKMVDRANFDVGHLQDLKEKNILYRTLSHREQEILQMIANEMTTNEIAKKLFIESSTVGTHRKHILKKLQVKSSIGLVKYAQLFPYREV